MHILPEEHSLPHINVHYHSPWSVARDVQNLELVGPVLELVLWPLQLDINRAGMVRHAIEFGPHAHSALDCLCIHLMRYHLCRRCLTELPQRPYVVDVGMSGYDRLEPVQAEPKQLYICLQPLEAQPGPGINEYQVATIYQIDTAVSGVGEVRAPHMVDIPPHAKGLDSGQTCSTSWSSLATSQSTPYLPIAAIR